MPKQKQAHYFQVKMHSVLYKYICSNCNYLQCACNEICDNCNHLICVCPNTVFGDDDCEGLDSAGNFSCLSNNSEIKIKGVKKKVKLKRQNFKRIMLEKIKILSTILVIMKMVQMEVLRFRLVTGRALALNNYH